MPSSFVVIPDQRDTVRGAGSLAEEYDFYYVHIWYNYNSVEQGGESP